MKIGTSVKEILFFLSDKFEGSMLVLLMVDFIA
jgi:hypothetical protein